MQALTCATLSAPRRPMSSCRLCVRAMKPHPRRLRRRTGGRIASTGAECSCRTLCPLRIPIELAMTRGVRDRRQMLLAVPPPPFRARPRCDNILSPMQVRKGASGRSEGASTAGRRSAGGARTGRCGARRARLARTSPPLRVSVAVWQRESSMCTPCHVIPVPCVLRSTYLAARERLTLATRCGHRSAVLPL